MKWSLALAIAAIFIGNRSTPADDKPAPVKQLVISTRVFEGDPQGSREAGTLEISEPSFVTMENMPCFLSIGGEISVAEGGHKQVIPYGRRIEFKPGTITNGKVRLDITLSNTVVDEQTDQRVQLHTDSKRTIATVRLGEVVKFRWGNGSAHKQAWLEIVVGGEQAV